MAAPSPNSQVPSWILECLSTMSPSPLTAAGSNPHANPDGSYLPRPPQYSPSDDVKAIRAAISPVVSECLSFITPLVDIVVSYVAPTAFPVWDATKHRAELSYPASEDGRTVIADRMIVDGYLLIVPFPITGRWYWSVAVKRKGDEAWFGVTTDPNPPHPEQFGTLSTGMEQRWMYYGGREVAIEDWQRDRGSADRYYSLRDGPFGSLHRAEFLICNCCDPRPPFDAPTDGHTHDAANANATDTDAKDGKDAVRVGAKQSPATMSTMYRLVSGRKCDGEHNLPTLDPFRAGDIVGAFVDTDAGVVVFYRNGRKQYTFGGLPRNQPLYLCATVDYVGDEWILLPPCREPPDLSPSASASAAASSLSAPDDCDTASTAASNSNDAPD